MKQLFKYDLRFLAWALLLSLFFIGCSDDNPVDPTADFSYEIDANNSVLVHFEAIATNGVTLAWDFGDGSYSIAKSTSHQYSSGGTYNVKLIIYGEEGSTPAEVEKSVFVLQQPTANFNFEIEDLTVTFTSTTTGATTFAWDFGDGATSTEKNPVHSYADYGDYTVSFIASGQVESTPAMVTKLVSVQFNAPVFEPVTVENADFELPGTTKQQNWDNVPGWSSDSQAVDSGVEGGGPWTAFLYNKDPSVYNLTSHIIAEGEEFKLNFDAWDIYYGGDNFIATIYYDTGDGVRKVLATQAFVPANGLELLATATTASVGASLGIEFLTGSAGDPNWGNNGWTGFDSIQLFAK